MSFSLDKNNFKIAGEIQIEVAAAGLNRADLAQKAGAYPPPPGASPILGVDVWEHAYYIDYRNMRPKFVETFLDKLVNWSFAEKNFG